MDLKSSKIESKWGQEGAGKVKNGAKRLNMEPTWRQREEYVLGGPFWARKSGQHGRKMGPHIEPKSMKNRCQNRSKKRCLSRSIFGTILVDFLMENGRKLAPKRDQKSIFSWKRRKAKNAYKTYTFLMIFEVRGVQVGSKNQSKIDPKMSSTWEVILTSIFDRFWSIFGPKLASKMDGKSIKNRCPHGSKKRADSGSPGRGRPLFTPHPTPPAGPKILDSGCPGGG